MLTKLVVVQKGGPDEVRRVHTGFQAYEFMMEKGRCLHPAACSLSLRKERDQSLSKTWKFIFSADKEKKGTENGPVLCTLHSELFLVCVPVTQGVVKAARRTGIFLMTQGAHRRVVPVRTGVGGRGFTAPSGAFRMRCIDLMTARNIKA